VPELSRHPLLDARVRGADRDRGVAGSSTPALKRVHLGDRRHDARRARGHSRCYGDAWRSGALASAGDAGALATGAMVGAWPPAGRAGGLAPGATTTGACTVGFGASVSVYGRLR